MKLYEIYTKPLIIESYQKVKFDNIKPYSDIIKKYFKRKQFIYRGMDSTGDFIIGDGSNMQRKSANTSGKVNDIIDNLLPAWSIFPKRSKSFICATSISNSSNYGDALYYVIPLENQPIGICPAEDFWFSFNSKLNDTVEELDFFLVDAFKQAGINKITQHNIPELENALDKFDQLMQTDKYKPVAWYEKFYEMFKGKLSREVFTKILDPKANGFKLTTGDKFSVKDNREIWMSGKVLFINMDVDIKVLLRELT